MSDSAPQSNVLKLIDRLRNEVSTDDLLVVLALLIYLRWADFLEAEQEATAAFEDTGFEPVLPSTLHWRTWHQLPTPELQLFLRERLAPALEYLGNHHQHPLAIHMHRVGQALDPLLQLSELSLLSLVRWLEEQPFETPSDRRHLLDTFDVILDKVSDSRIGEYRTPSPVARLMAALGRPMAGEWVYDPAFGMGNLLTNVCDLLASRDTKERPNSYAIPGISASGVEINARTYVIGLMRLALAGVDDPHLELGNSLERYPASHLDKDRFDLVLVDPPFGMRVNREGLYHFPIRSRNATSLFVQHALATLRNEGRAIIVVPYGLLSNRSEKDLRRWLLEQNRVEAVIDLPGNAFAPLMTTRICLMILGRNGPTERVRMVDAQPFFDESRGRQPSQIKESALTALVQAVYAPSPGKSAWDIDIEALQTAEWDLTPRRRERSELTRVLNELSSEVETHRLDEISGIMAGRSIPSADLVDRPPGENPVPYIRIKDVERGKASRSSSWLSAKAVAGVKPEWRLRAGDILLSKSGTIGKVGIVQNGALGAVAASGHYIIRTEKDRLDPHFLLAYFNSNACRSWLRERASGSVISHLPIRVIAELPIPVPPLPIQMRVASQYRDHKVDAFLYLAKLLSQGESDEVAESIDRWLDQALRSFAAVKDQEIKIETVLDNFEKLASDPIPVRYCDDCGKPYWLAAAIEQLEVDSSNITRIVTRKIADPHICEVCLTVGSSKDDTDFTRFKGGGPLVDWAAMLNGSLGNLDDISKLPPGITSLHILQNALNSIMLGEQKIRGHMPNEEKARHFSRTLERYLTALVHRLTETVDPEFEVNTHRLIRGKLQNLIVRVINRGFLPLRDFRLNVSSDWGMPLFDFIGLDLIEENSLADVDGGDDYSQESAEWKEARLPFLAEHANESIRLHGTVPKAAKDKVSIELIWSATNIAGETVQGRRQIALRVVDGDQEFETDTPLELGGSPYVCGDPVRPERSDVFFGREELIEQIRRQVLKSGNVVLLEGNRRAGKTSILRHLEGSRSIPGWLGVYCSLQGAEGSQEGVGVPTAEVFREVAKSLARAVHGYGLETPLPDGSLLSPGSRPLGIAKACRAGIGQEAAFSDFREYVEVLLEPLREKSLGVLLMLDEFDKLQEGIDNGITSPQVPENIRFLVQTYPGFSAILTGSRRLKRLREEYWSALFGLGTRLGISSLSRGAARRLVTEPVQGRISYSSEAMERAIDLTAGQPYLLQCLCNRIFDRIARGASRTVTIDIVDAAGKELVLDNEHFATLWSYAGSHRRRFLLALCNLEEKERDPLRLGELSELLAGHGIEVSDDIIIADLEFLRELELIDFVSLGGEGRYRLTIPLMGQWIEAQQDFDALRTQARYETEDEHA